MEKFFNIFLEFNHQTFNNIIESAIKKKTKGYICVVDGNVLTMAQKNLQYCEVLNSSIVNTCDGSSIAMLAGFIHKKQFRAFNCPDIFTYYIEKDYK